jgi:putative hydrolase of the HAD superfamily
VERECVIKHGYGLQSFTRALVDTFERLSPIPVTPDLHAQVVSFTGIIQNHDIEFLSEVPETLDYLSRKHRLILVTKGALAEQTGKVERSGVKKYFAAVEVVPEKNAEVYAHLAAKYECNHACTWMIGNSPKSDINPALAAGMNAIFVPHGDTWILEHEEVNAAPAGQKLLIVCRFAELREHF